jgi:hypothetical protein
MKLIKISLEKFQELNPLAKQMGLDHSLKINSVLLFFKPESQDFPIDKVSVLKQAPYFEESEYFCEKLEAPLSRWEICGLPVSIVKDL